MPLYQSSLGYNMGIFCHKSYRNAMHHYFLKWKEKKSLIQVPSACEKNSRHKPRQVIDPDTTGVIYAAKKEM